MSMDQVQDSPSPSVVGIFLGCLARNRERLVPKCDRLGDHAPNAHFSCQVDEEPRTLCAQSHRLQESSEASQRSEGRGKGRELVDHHLGFHSLQDLAQPLLSKRIANVSIYTFTAKASRPLFRTADGACLMPGLE